MTEADGGLDATSDADGADASAQDGGSEAAPRGGCANLEGLQSGAPWPMFGGCPNHQWRSGSVAAQTNLRPFTVSLAPGSDLNGAGHTSTPSVAADGTIYVGGADGYLYAVDQAGSQRWKARTGAYIASSPAIAKDGTIYVGSEDNLLYAVAPADGSIKWTFRTGGAIDSSPAVGSDGTVYVGSLDGMLYAVDPSSHSAKWMFHAGGAIRTSPAIAPDGTVCFAADDSAAYAVRQDGTKKWRYPFGTDSGGSPGSVAIDDDGTTYVVSHVSDSQASLLAIDATGALVHSVPIGDDVVASPGIGPDGSIYVVGLTRGSVYVFGPTLNLRATYNPPPGSDRATSSPAIGADGTVYVAFWALSIPIPTVFVAFGSDGGTKWSEAHEGFPSSAAIASGSVIWFADGVLYGYRP